MDEMEMATRGNQNTSSEESSEDDPENQNIKKDPYRRRGERKSRYLFKVNIPYFGKQRVDHCLCARLILASVLMTIIIMLFYCMWSLDRDLKKR